MKKVLISMFVMYLLVVWPGSGIWSILSKVIGGGVAETYLYPIYGGIILLAGLITGCTVVVCDEIRSLKEELKEWKREKDS